MKKKVIIIILFILILLLIPIPFKLRDGGSTEYRAILYSVTKYNRLSEIVDDGTTKYISGTEIKVLGFEVYNDVVESIEGEDNSKIEDSSGKISTVLTLEDEIQADTIWCGTFQLIWNDLKNDLAKQDIVFSPQLEVVENLNKETFTIDDISEESYYKKIGTPSIELKEEIENAIKEKFNETSSILDDFDWENARPEDYFLYVMLKKEFEFETEFEEVENGKFGEYDDIEFFGIETDETGSLRGQVQVLYYDSKDDFAIKLKTKQNDEVILAKGITEDSFKDIYNEILKNEEQFEGEKSFTEMDEIKVPKLDIDEKKRLSELENKIFSFSDGTEYEIDEALQTIKFELDEKGGKIKSEAGMMVRENAILLTENIERNFYLDDEFIIFLKEEDKDKPYFAAKINDITKFE